MTVATPAMGRHDEDGNDEVRGGRGVVARMAVRIHAPRLLCPPRCRAQARQYEAPSEMPRTSGSASVPPRLASQSACATEAKGVDVRLQIWSEIGAEPLLHVSTAKAFACASVFLCF